MDNNISQLESKLARTIEMLGHTVDALMRAKLLRERNNLRREIIELKVSNKVQAKNLFSRIAG